MNVDLHAHVLIEAVEALVRGQPGWAAELSQQLRWQGEASARRNLELFAARYMHALTSLDARLAAMDAMGVQVQAVSLSPTQYHYWTPAELAERIVCAANEGLAALCATHPARLVGLATVALQHPQLAAEQLRHAVRVLGLRGVEISTRADDLDLGDARLEPFWAEAEALEAVVFVHPLGCPFDHRLSHHYLSNVVGQPLETTVALSRLIFAGVLDRHPGLQLLAAHGGGYLPYYIGRSDHAAEVRPECGGLEHAPSAYLRRIHYDTLVYDPLTLRHLVGRVGADRLVLGTDYPFDMGVSDPLERLDALGELSQQALAQIRGGNAARLLKLDRPPASAGARHTPQPAAAGAAEREVPS